MSDVAKCDSCLAHARMVLFAWMAQERLPQDDEPESDLLTEADVRFVVDAKCSHLVPEKTRGEEEATLGECAAAVGVTGERARQVEQEALAKMQHNTTMREWAGLKPAAGRRPTRTQIASQGWHRRAG